LRHSPLQENAGLLAQHDTNSSAVALLVVKVDGVGELVP